MTNGTTEHPILYFDGVCNLCNYWVVKVIKHDPGRKFRFASLQSRAGERVKEAVKAATGRVPDSVILAHEGKYYVKSDAILKTAMMLGGWYKLLAPAYLLPKGVRNAMYDLVARNRYKWFGKKDACMVPTPELKSLFAED